MSEESKENEEEFGTEKVEVTIKKPKAENQSELEAQLKEEKEKRADVEASLEVIAEQEFVRAKADIMSRAKKVGITIQSDDIPNDEPEKLVAYTKIVKEQESKEKAEKELREKTKAPASGTPITGAQTGDNQPDQSGKPLEERTYESEADLVRDLENEKKAGNPEATKVLNQLSKKMQKKGIDLEFQGNLPKLAGQVDPVKDKGKTKEELEAERRAEEKKFKDVNRDE